MARYLLTLADDDAAWLEDWLDHLAGQVVIGPAGSAGNVPAAGLDRMTGAEAAPVLARLAGGTPAQVELAALAARPGLNSLEKAAIRRVQGLLAGTPQSPGGYSGAI